MYEYFSSHSGLILADLSLTKGLNELDFGIAY